MPMRSGTADAPTQTMLPMTDTATPVHIPIPARLSLWRRWSWSFVYVLTIMWFKLGYRIRIRHTAPLPGEGPVLYVTNHQSFIDPLIIGVAVYPRPCFFLARASLWHHRLLAPLITTLNAIPVERGAADMKAMRSCIDVMQAGHALNIFPEGTRTADGSVRDFATGTMLLIKRARPTVVPIAIDGAYEIWPRQRSKPRLRGRLRVTTGRPVAAQELIALPAEQALAQLREQIVAMLDADD